jgi:hypothetical protein
MNLKGYKIIFVLFSYAVAVCWANSKVETKIGAFDLDKLTTESQFVSQYGEGNVQMEKVDDKVLGKRHIYYVSNSKLWVEARFSHVLGEDLQRVLEAVLVTKQKICDERFRPKNLLTSLITSKGVKIGDSIDKVVSIYGKASIHIDIKKDKTFSVLREDLKLKEGQILRYFGNKPNELFFSEFYFGKEGLHSFMISKSE